MKNNMSSINIFGIVFKAGILLFLLSLAAVIWYLLEMNKMLENNINMLTNEKTTMETKLFSLIKESKEKDQALETLQNEKIAMDERMSKSLRLVSILCNRCFCKPKNNNELTQPLSF